MVNYVTVNQAAWNKLKKMKVGERTESDHQPLKIDTERENKRVRGKEIKKFRTVINWDESSIEEYREKKIRRKIEGEKVEEIWKNVKIGIEESISKKKVKVKKRKIGENSGMRSARE